MLCMLPLNPHGIVTLLFLFLVCVQPNQRILKEDLNALHSSADITASLLISLFFFFLPKSTTLSHVYGDMSILFRYTLPVQIDSST